ncbi:hypothetical protein HMSSN036_59470 [Paenibacillus macerans]|nr:hypothetical protein HMSSN036_59470 [Paenibacillus macerans]
MKIEDMLRFGLLYLNKGKRNSSQVIPADWIEKSTNVATLDGPAYGYHWWVLNSDTTDTVNKTFYAMGKGSGR